MHAKRLEIVSVRMSDEEVLAVRREASRRGMLPSEFIRELAITAAAETPKGERAHGKPAAVAKAPACRQIDVHNVDTLGADPLRLDNGALAK